MIRESNVGQFTVTCENVMVRKKIKRMKSFQMTLILIFSCGITLFLS